MNKFLLSIIALAVVSCSTKSDILKKTNCTVPLKSGDKVFVINKKDKFENIARFNYYTIDTNLISKLATFLKSQNISNQYLINSNFSTETIEDAKTLASLYGYEKLMFIDSNYKINSNLNILALGYITIVGMYIFPGNSISASIDMNMEIVDIKTNKTLYNNNFISKSHKYLYRLGNSQSVIKSSITEANEKVVFNFSQCLLDGVKK